MNLHILDMANFEVPYWICWQKVLRRCASNVYQCWWLYGAIIWWFADGSPYTSILNIIFLVKECEGCTLGREVHRLCFTARLTLREHARERDVAIHSVLHLHSNRFMWCMELQQGSPSFWGRVCIGRAHTDSWWRIVSLFEPSASKCLEGVSFPSNQKLDFWLPIQSEPWSSDTVGQSARFDFWSGL